MKVPGLVQDAIDEAVKNHDEHRMYLEYGVHIHTRTLYIQGDPEDAFEHFVKGLHILESISFDPIYINLCSVGGDWYTGMGIFDAIQKSPCLIQVQVLGSAMSMASIILQAADTRVMMPNAVLMLHNGHESIEGNPHDVANWAKQSQKALKTMYGIYAHKSNKNVAYWRRKCKTDLILTAPEALNLGLIDHII